MFLQALNTAGRAHYLGPQLLLDTAYPLLVALLIFETLRTLAPGRVVGWATICLPVVLSDWLENALVARLLLQHPATATDAQIKAASLATQAKSGFSLLAVTILIVVALVALRRWFCSGQDAEPEPDRQHRQRRCDQHRGGGNPHPHPVDGGKQEGIDAGRHRR